MLPDRLKFLGRFDNFYQALVNSVKEDKINEGEFYHFIIAEAEDINSEWLDGFVEMVKKLEDE